MKKIFNREMRFKIRKKNASSIECLDMYEADDEGFIEGDIDFGNPVASFSFNKSLTSQNNNQISSQDNVLNTTPAYSDPKFKFLTPPQED